MSNKFTYDFEELPLIVEDGFRAGMVDGSAVIEYWADGSWLVTEVSLMASKYDREKGWQSGHIEVEPGQVRNQIVHQLDSLFRGHIEDMIWVVSGITGRTDYEEHNTLNKAQQGIK